MSRPSWPHAIELEREAARRYEELAAAMRTEGNRELQAFFTAWRTTRGCTWPRRATAAGFATCRSCVPQFEWPDGTAPETAGWAGVDALMEPRAALELALSGERRGHAYYAAMAATTSDPEVRRIAGEFAREEAQHVCELEKLLACPAPPPDPTTGAVLAATASTAAMPGHVVSLRPRHPEVHRTGPDRSSRRCPCSAERGDEPALACRADHGLRDLPHAGWRRWTSSAPSAPR
jgi:hypothetical protein